MAGVLFGKLMANLDLGVTLVIVVGGFDVAQRVVDSAQGVVVRLARGGGDSGEVKLVGARLQRGRLPQVARSHSASFSLAPSSDQGLRR